MTKDNQLEAERVLDEIISNIEDYCVTGALGGSPFNTVEENEKLRIDAVENGRKQAKKAILSRFISKDEVREAIKSSRVLNLNVDSTLDGQWIDLKQIRSKLNLEDVEG